MPALIGVMEFVDETTADHKSPITSTFVSRMNNMRQTISTLEEVSWINYWGLLVGRSIIGTEIIIYY